MNEDEDAGDVDEGDSADCVDMVSVRLEVVVDCIDEPVVIVALGTFVVLAALKVVAV